MIARRPSRQVFGGCTTCCATFMTTGPAIADVQQPLYAQHVWPMRLQQHAQPAPEARPVERSCRMPMKTTPD